MNWFCMIWCCFEMVMVLVEYKTSKSVSKSPKYASLVFTLPWTNLSMHLIGFSPFILEGTRPKILVVSIEKVNWLGFEAREEEFEIWEPCPWCGWRGEVREKDRSRWSISCLEHENIHGGTALRLAVPHKGPKGDYKPRLGRLRGLHIHF